MSEKHHLDLWIFGFNKCLRPFSSSCDVPFPFGENPDMILGLRTPALLERWRRMALGDKLFPCQTKDLTENLFTAQQAFHCQWVPRLNWMVHRLLNYFYIPAFHGRLKAYYWRDWDHRNLLHVWPFKAFHCDGSQVRIYWNQFLSQSPMHAHQHNTMKRSLC